MTMIIVISAMILKVIGGWWVQSDDDGDVGHGDQCSLMIEMAMIMVIHMVEIGGCWVESEDDGVDLDDIYGDCADDYDSSDGQSPLPIKVFWGTLVGEHKLDY